MDLTTAADEPLRKLLRLLTADGYRFVTATPATHTRFLAHRPGAKAGSVRDVLGWNLPFEKEALPPKVFELLSQAGVVSRGSSHLFSSGIRVSSFRDTLFLHSAFPTLDKDSVFLGPDSYRFADFIVRNLDGVADGANILDYGAGAGVGGIVAAKALPNSDLTLADLNPAALKLSSINAEVAAVRHRAVEARKPQDVDGTFDLVVTHPPFMMDEQSRAYRDGGDLYGARLSLDWVVAGIEKLNSGGKLVLHTGVSIVDGRDVLLDRLEQDIPAGRFRWEYSELDPDIFSEDLDRPAYESVERIAAVGLTVVRTN